MVKLSDIEWLSDYCRSFRTMLQNDPNMPFVEKCEIQAKLKASNEQLKEWKKNQEKEYECN